MVTSFDNGELLIPGYGIVRNNRNKFGGGVAIYMDENLEYEEIQINYSGTHDITTTHVEALWIEVKPSKSAHLLLGSAYRPPNSDGRSFIGYLEHALATIQHERFQTIVLGDFNLDVKSHDKMAITKDFLYTMQFYDLQQLIHEAT